MSGVRYPDIHVELLGQDGNAFMILGLVQRAMRKAKVPQEIIRQYVDEATSGDYDHLLQVTMQWVEVD